MSHDYTNSPIPATTRRGSLHAPKPSKPTRAPRPTAADIVRREADAAGMSVKGYKRITRDARREAREPRIIVTPYAEFTNAEHAELSRILHRDADRAEIDGDRYAAADLRKRAEWHDHGAQIIRF